MKIESKIRLVDDILDEWRGSVVNDFTGYRNHVYRMINFCFALRQPDADEREKIVIAACFHDLGIWSANTFDYLSPSIALANDYLKVHSRTDWIAEVDMMIDQHHKIRKYEDRGSPLIENFRQGDLVDFSLGLIKCGLPVSFIHDVRQQFPNSGFHRQLVERAARWVCRHPLDPLPVLKW